MPQNIFLLSGGAADGLVTALAPGFRTETGVGVQGTFGAVGAIREKLCAGEAADLVILTKPIIDELSQAGIVARDSVQDIGIVRTAIAVRTGDPVPRVATADELRAALLAADEIHFPDTALATAGIHFAKVLDRLGIAERVAQAVRTHPNGATAMRALAASDAKFPIGCTQVTEIIITEGARLVANLPEELGLATTYTAAVVTDAPNAAIAQAFVLRLTAKDSAAQRRQAGFE